MKWYSYIICSFLILVGCFFGIKFYQDLTATSYVNGSIDITNKFSQDSFYYVNSSVVFYPTENSEAYAFEIDCLETENFDGERKEYKVVLNNYILTDTTITGGSISSVIKMDFYDVDGKLLHNAEMNLLIRFLSEKTQLKLSCADQTSATYFENYFSDNGIRLGVIEQLES